MRDAQETLTSMGKEFISTFRGSLDPALYIELVKEEVEETLAEFDEKGEKLLKELTDLMYVTVGFQLVVAGAEQLGLLGDRGPEWMEVVTDAAGVHERAMEILGEDIDYYEAFRRVHLSNMSKLGEDGKPIWRDDGKVLKGPNYKEPDLKDLL